MSWNPTHLFRDHLSTGSVRAPVNKASQIPEGNFFHRRADDVLEEGFLDDLALQPRHANIQELAGLAHHNIIVIRVPVEVLSHAREG